MPMTDCAAQTFGAIQSSTTLASNCDYTSLAAENITINAGGNIGTNTNPLLINLPSSGRIQLRSFNNFGVISLATDSAFDSDITQLITDVTCSSVLRTQRYSFNLQPA